jgi:predicted metal-dependent phosphoesterase TrpH
MKADLHVHSNYSDGTMSIEEIRKYAKTKDLSVVAITDHDNLKSSEIISSLEEVLMLIGVELSTYHNNENIHILGYFYNNNVNSIEIINYLNELRVKRDKRIYTIIEKLKEFYNININYEDVIKFSHGAIGRVHVAKAISEKYGCTLDEAFDRYIGNNAKGYVPTTNFCTKDAIDMLHRNNAIAVIAHPGHIKNNLVEDIVKLGVDGIEAYYPEHSKEDIFKYLDIAERYDLLVTGGSDFHGIGVREDLGASTISDKDIEKLLNKLNVKFKA